MAPLWWWGRCTDLGSFSLTSSHYMHTTNAHGRVSIRWPRRLLAILRFYGSKTSYLVGTRLLPGSQDVIQQVTVLVFQSWFRTLPRGFLPEAFTEKLFAKGFKEKNCWFSTTGQSLVQLVGLFLKERSSFMQHNTQGSGQLQNITVKKDLIDPLNWGNSVLQRRKLCRERLSQSRRNG